MSFLIAWRETNAWTRVSSGFVASLSLLVVLTLFGWMKPPLSLFALIPLAFALGSAAALLVRTRDWWRLGLLAALALVAALNLWGETPSLFTGRDQGSIAVAAWELARQGNLFTESQAASSFFEIYGVGTALNFPGFAYSETGALVTQFPLGMTAWIAGFVGWLGLSGYAIAGSLLFILSGWSFYELAHHFVRRPLALAGTVLFSLSFLPIWLLHFALSEQLALALFLVLAQSLIHLSEKPRIVPYALAGLSASLFLFTRIEGLAIFPIAAILMLSSRDLRSWVTERAMLRLVLPLLILVFLFLRDFFVNLPFYTIMGKVVVKHWHELTLLGMSDGGSSLSPALLLSLYGFWPVFLLGGIGLGFFFWQKNRRGLMVLALALPTFAYLVDAHITPDHPWMLRRYAFTLWPVFVLGLVSLWHTAELRFPRMKTTAGFALASLCLVLSQFPAARVAWGYDPYSALLPSTETLAQEIGDSDLLLIDRGSSGDPHALVAGPLQTFFGKQAAYFFNPEDLERLDASPYQRIFYLESGSRETDLEKALGIPLEERTAFNFVTRRIVPVSLWSLATEEHKTRATLYEVVR